MLKYVLFTLSILLATFSCTSEEENIFSDIDGSYTGQFERNGYVSGVTLNFISGEYNGTSVEEKFPAIGLGSYSVNNGVIHVSDELPWTAEFDWTLIFNEEWNYTLIDNVLTLTKSNGDKYTLNKVLQ